MKILLVDPPGNLFGVNVGIGYLVGALKATGHTPVVLDLNNYRRIPWNILLRNFIDHHAPEVVGISVMSLSFPFTTTLIRELRQYYSGPIILGGAHVTIHKKELFTEASQFDCLIMGEGELTLPALLTHIEQEGSLAEMPGVLLRSNGTVLGEQDFPLIKDLDSLPFPDFTAGGVREMERYPLLTSRGCPFHCIYCESAVLHKRKWRPRQPRNLIEELKRAIETYRIRYFIIQDDNFTLNKERAFEFLNLLITEKLNLPWLCTNGIRADTITEELACLMRRAGCQSVSLGVESLDPGVFNRLKKGETLDDIRKAVFALRNAGLTVNGLFIVGLPGDTAEKSMRSYQEGKRLGLSRMFFQPLIPFPATEVYEWSLKHGTYYMHYQDASLSRLDVVFDTEAFPRTQRIKTVHKLAMKSKVYPRDPEKSSLWNLFHILGMILRYDALGLPSHLRWLFQKGVAILGKGRIKVEATIQLDESHYRVGPHSGTS